MQAPEFVSGFRVRAFSAPRNNTIACCPDGLPQAPCLASRPNAFARAGDTMTAVEFAAGGLRIVQSVFPFGPALLPLHGFHDPARAVSAGRCRSRHGFAEDRALHQKTAGRPLTSFCACELRSPAPFSDARLSCVQPGLRGDTCATGASCKGRAQPGCAQQCLPGDRPAGRALVSRLLLHGRRRKTPRRASSSPAAARRSEGGASYARAKQCATARPSAEAMRERARYVLGEMERRLAQLAQPTGPRPPRRRSTPCTTFIRFSPRRSCAAARPAPG